MSSTNAPQSAAFCKDCPFLAQDLASDILRGAEEISIFLYGSARYRRRVFHLIATGRLPVFRLGTSIIHARRSTLVRYIRAQEQRNAQGIPPPIDGHSFAFPCEAGHCRRLLLREPLSE